MENVRIYKLVHYYSINQEVEFAFIETPMNEEELIDAVATIQFRFEELLPLRMEELREEEDISVRGIAEMLEQFYGAKNVTPRFLPYALDTSLEPEQWKMLNYVDVTINREKHERISFTQLDLYSAREYSCGDRYTILMQKDLPKSEAFTHALLVYEG